MDMNFESYEYIINEINKNTESLSKINEKLAMITLTKEEEKLFEKLNNNYQNNELFSKYLKDHQEEYRNYKNLYKYLKLYIKGLETNEAISLLVNNISDEMVEDEEQNT